MFKEKSMRVGQPVEVHTKFDDSWSTGFEIAEVVTEGYKVRRQSDGSLLPGVTGEADLRPAVRGASWARRGF
jgi:hypothetical protein